MKVTRRKGTTDHIPSRYYLEHGKYKFSLIRLPAVYKLFEKNLWEIYQVKGPNLIRHNDIERYQTKKEAVKRATYLVKMNLWIRFNKKFLGRNYL